MTHNATILKATRLSKRFRKTQVLESLDFELQPGEVTVLLGTNGAGKSTFLKLALGVLAAEGGSLEVFGMSPLKDAKRIRQATGFVPDKPDVYGWMTAADLFHFLKPQYPTWNDDAQHRLVEFLGVPLDVSFQSLSRGQGMKAMLAAALAPQPELLLLDEPFAGLDPLVREEVLRGIIGELREGERTVLCATHDLDVAARIADRVAILANGRIEKHGTLKEVLGEREEVSRVPERMRDALADAASAEQKP